ncbi:MAG: aldehyde dehydrogenase family protein [Candidatus Woesearchaeota archaeon]
MVIKSINPTNKKLIEIHSENTNEEIINIIKRSKEAFKKWSNLDKNKRIFIINELKKNFISNKDKIINTINLDCGFEKAEIEGVFYDIIDAFDYYIEEYTKLNKVKFSLNQEVFPQSNCDITYHPYGVILQIGVWNYPFWQTMISAIPALLTGNVIIFKPSEKSTIVGKLIHKIINSSKNMPKNVFNIVIGGKKQGEFLVKQEDIDYIVYTGNIKTGKKIQKNSDLKPTLLELSGNDATIISNDCNVKQTINGVISGSFLHSGEVCCKIKRIYLTNKKLIPKLIKKTNQIKNKVTPIIDKKQLLKIDLQVKKTIKEGAKLLSGGKIMKKDGFYYEPTILLLDNNNYTSIKEEIFGPVVSIIITKSDKESIIYSNSTKYGLGASIWTKDIKKAKEYANQLDVGIIWVNDSNIPLVGGEYFQGWKNSSIPSSSSRLMKFVKSKTQIYHNSTNNRDWWWN